MSQDTEQSFIETFNSIARHKHRYEVFRDFVIISAISLHNAVAKNESLEAEYMEIIGKYSKEEANQFAELLGCLINLLEPEPADVLGQLYMNLDLGNTQVGQFFTPSHISDLMAELIHGDQVKAIDKPFITLSEPACGAGGMVLAFVKVMLKHGHNPAHKLWVQCVDIDRTASLMCYVQLALWNVPAQVIVGDTLKMDYREQYFTPAHYLFGWDAKLQTQKTLDMILELESFQKLASDISVEEDDKPKIVLSSDNIQLDLF